MKKIIAVVVVLCLIIIAFRVRTGLNRLFGFSHYRHGTTTIIENTDNETVRIEYSGHFLFKEDETGIKRMTPDSYLDFRRDDRRMVVELNRQNRINYVLYDGSAQVPMNAGGRDFIAGAVKEMISMGVFAGERAEQLYRIGGDSLVLSKIPELTSDQAKTAYRSYLLQRNTLTPNEMAFLLHETGKVGSDIEKQQLLSKVPDTDLNNTLTARSYLEATGTIGSDIEKERALRHLTGHRLTNEQYDGALCVIDNIHSDIEKQQALNALLDRSDAPDSCFGLLLKTISHIDSDIEKANVLGSVLQKVGKNPAQWTALIGTISGIDSDIQKDDLLLEVSRRMPRTSDVEGAYMTAAKTISSEQDYARAVSAVK